jgi:hypothetical protein
MPKIINSEYEKDKNNNIWVLRKKIKSQDIYGVSFIINVRAADPVICFEPEMLIS